MLSALSPYEFHPANHPVYETSFISGRYQVEVHQHHSLIAKSGRQYDNLLIFDNDIFWFSFKRRDKTAILDRNEYQKLVNVWSNWFNKDIPMAFFELFPAESRLVDTSNQYHLWAGDFKSQGVFGKLCRAAATKTYKSTPTSKKIQLGSIDIKDMHDWREIQQIKNAFAGPEAVGVQMFRPNTSSHELIIVPTELITFGYTKREVLSPEELAIAFSSLSNGQQIGIPSQRPFANTKA